MDWDKIGKKNDLLKKAKQERREHGPAALDISSIYTRKQVRKGFDEASLNELANDIKQNGLLQPVIVCQGDEEGTYELLYGERRWRACKQIELKSIDAFIVPRPDTEASRYVKQLSENIHRDPLSAMEIALALAVIQEEKNLSMRGVADYASKDVKWVSSHFALLKGSKDIQNLVSEGFISDVDVADSLTKIERQDPAKASELIQNVRNGSSLSRKEARAIVRNLKAEVETSSATGNDQQSGEKGENLESGAKGVGHAQQKKPSPGKVPYLAKAADHKAWKPRDVNEAHIRVRVVFQGNSVEGRLLIDRADEDDGKSWVLTDDDAELRVPLKSISIISMK